MKSIFKKFSILLFILLVGALQADASARTKYAPFVISGIYLTEQEYFSLPDFLQVKVRYHIGGNSPDYRHWSRRMGVDYQHYHHWAAGIVKFQRAMEPKNFGKRNYLLNESLGEYNYLIRHCLPTNQFRYLFHLRRGEILYIQQKYSDAANELQESLNYKADYEQTYSVLSKVYEALGMKTQAGEAMQKANSLKAE